MCHAHYPLYKLHFNTEIHTVQWNLFLQPLSFVTTYHLWPESMAPFQPLTLTSVNFVFSNHKQWNQWVVIKHRFHHNTMRRTTMFPFLATISKSQNVIFTIYLLVLLFFHPWVMTPLEDGFPLFFAWEAWVVHFCFLSCLDTLPSYEFPNVLCFFTHKSHISGRKNLDVGSWDIHDSSYCTLCHTQSCISHTWSHLLSLSRGYSLHVLCGWTLSNKCLYTVDIGICIYAEYAMPFDVLSFGHSQNLDTGKHCKYKQNQLFPYCQLPYLHFHPFALISLVLMKPVVLTNWMQMELCVC